MGCFLSLSLPHVVHVRLYLSGIAGFELEGRLDDALTVENGRASVAERISLFCPLRGRARLIHGSQRDQAVGDGCAEASRVHLERAAHGPRNAEELLQTRKAPDAHVLMSCFRLKPAPASTTPPLPSP